MTTSDLGSVIRKHGLLVADSLTDVDELVDTMIPFTRPHRIITRGRNIRLDATVSAIRSAHIAFTRVVYGADVQVQPLDPRPDRFMLILGITGRARWSYGGDLLPFTGTESTFASPYRESRTEVGHDYDQVIVSISRDRVESMTGSLLGDDAPTRPTLPLAAFDFGPTVHSLLAATASMAATPSTPADRTLSARLDDLLIESVLRSLPLDWHSRPSGTAHRNRHVRTAMEYMNENLAEPILLTDVARHVGVTPRTVQNAFRTELDTTPMAWLRNHRLDRARALIHSESLAAAQHPVRDIALATGHFHPGQFATEFAARFGELPSAMIRRIHARRFT